MRITGSAVVTVTVKVNLTDSWGGDATLSQVKGQALREVEKALMRGLAINGQTIGDQRNKVNGKIVGEPKVETIICEI